MMLDKLHAKLAAAPLAVRRATPEDAPAVAEMLGRLSSETRYLRYWTGRPLSGEHGRREAERITGLRAPHAFSLLATAPVEGREEVVGIAELVRDQQVLAVGEMALIVRDDWHGRGVGKMLTTLLLRIARAHAMRTVRGFCLPENRAMARLIRSLGEPHQMATRSGETEFAFDLASPTAGGAMATAAGASATIPLPLASSR